MEVEEGLEKVSGKGLERAFSGPARSTIVINEN